MNEQTIRQLFPNASQSTVDANTELQDTELERPVRDGALAKGKGKDKGAERIILSYTSYRQRLLDPDNLAGGTKFLTDALRYCGAIPDDQEHQIDLRFAQKKVETKAQEKTLIEITFPPANLTAR